LPTPHASLPSFQQTAPGSMLQAMEAGQGPGIRITSRGQSQTSVLERLVQ